MTAQTSATHIAESPASPLTIWTNIIIIASFWGTAFAFIRIAAVAGMTPFAIATARGVMAGTVISVWLVMTRRRLTIDRVMIRDILVLGVLNGFLPNVLLAVALSRIGSAPAAMIQASIPIIVTIFAPFVLASEAFGLRQIIGTLVGFVGVFVLIGPSAVVGGNATTLGSVAMLCVAVSYAASALYVRRVKPADPVGVALGQQIVASLAAGSLTIIFETQASWTQPISIWLALIGLAILSTVIPMIMYFRLLVIAPAGKAALVQYLLPLAASVYAVIFLNETIRPEVIFGGAIVLAGVWIAASSGSAPRQNKD